MKKSNRILSFLLALVMMVSLLPGNVAFAEDAEKVGRAAEGVGPYTGEVEDAGEEPEVPEDGGIIAPVTEPTPTPEEPEEPGDPDEPVGDGVPDVPSDAPDAAGSIAPAAETEAEVVASGVCGDRLGWILTDDGVLTISGDGAMQDYTWSTSGTTAPWYPYRAQIVEVVLPDGITTIGNQAFRNCSKMESINLPQSITSIGASAFSYCSVLKTVTIPGTVQSMGGSAFYSCSGLLTLVIEEGVPALNTYAFFGCTSLTSVTLPQSLQTINAQAFKNTKALTSITIPKRVTNIGTEAFADSGLTELHFACFAPKFGTNVFLNCSLTAYYPGADGSWTDQVRQQYGGTVNWVPVIQSYDLTIAGTRVTETNLSGLIDDTFYWRYEPDANTLHLQGYWDVPADYAYNYVIWNSIPGLTISVDFNMSLHAPAGKTDFRFLILNQDTTITGNGSYSLTFVGADDAASDGIYVGGATLTLRDLKLYAFNNIRYALNGGNSWQSALNLESCSGILTTTKAAIFCFHQGITLDDCCFVQPFGAVVDSQGIVCESDGSTWATRVVLGKGPYPLGVAGVTVTESNKDNILGDTGCTFSFDPDRLTLYINGNWQSTANAPVIENYIDGLTVVVASEYGALSSTSSSQSIRGQIESHGSLTIRPLETDAGYSLTLAGSGVFNRAGIHMYGNSTLTVQDMDLTITNTGYGLRGDLDGGSSALRLNNSRVSCEGIYTSGIYSFTGGVTLTGCGWAVPAYPKLSGGSLYIESWDEDQLVKDLLVHPTVYGLVIDGTRVYADNASDILGNGVFAYNYETNTLSISGNYTQPTATAELLKTYRFRPVIDSGLNELRIELGGDVTLTAALENYNSYTPIINSTGSRFFLRAAEGTETMPVLTLAGAGSLAFDGIHSKSLTVRDIDLRVGQGARKGLLGESGSVLTFINCCGDIWGYANDIGAAVTGYTGGISFDNCALVDGTVNALGMIVNGGPLGRVLISNAVYDLYVDGMRLYAGRTNVLDGRAVYDPETNTLTLDGLGEAPFVSAGVPYIENHIPGLTILVASGIELITGITVTGRGVIESDQDLTITAPGDTGRLVLTGGSLTDGIRMLNGADLTLQGVRILVSNATNGLVGTAGSALTVSGSWVEIHAGTAAVNSFTQGITLEQDKITDPEEAYVDGARIYDPAISAPAKTVTITPPEHFHDEIDFLPWTGATSLPSVPGSYYLCNDVTLSETWTVPDGRVDLCLNGHTIRMAESKRVIKIPDNATLNLYDCRETPGEITGGYDSDSGGGVYIDLIGTLNLYGGKITHNASGGNGGGVVSWGFFHMYGGEISNNSAEKGGGVYIGNNFTMSGGKISNNKADYGGGVYDNGTFTMTGGEISSNLSALMYGGFAPGGGVYVAAASKFTMTGGKIRNNRASAGGGVYIDSSSSTIRLSGAPVIEGNQYSGDSSLSDLYLANEYMPLWRITVSGALTEGARIGVRMQSPTVFTSGFNTYNAGKSPAAFFFSDDSSYYVGLGSGEALLTQETFIVSFSTTHGTTPAAQTVGAGGAATRPADPSEEGWIFQGWYKLAGLQISSEEYDFSAPVTADLVLFAKWTPVAHTVSFDVQGHGTAPASQTVNDGETATRPADPTAEGWTFGGWYTDAACTTEYDFTIPVTEDLTLYAKWTMVVYTVSFNANGHGTAPEAQTVNDGETATRPADPTAEGWTFGGWYTDAACTTEYNFTTPVTEDLTLYAKWTMASYDLWLGETQVTYFNKADILGNSTASFDPETNTLTFTTATPAITGLHENVLIWADGIDLTIVRNGSLSLASGIDAVRVNNGALQIGVEGAASFQGSVYGANGVTVNAKGDITLTEGYFGSNQGDILVTTETGKIYVYRESSGNLVSGGAAGSRAVFTSPTTIEFNKNNTNGNYAINFGGSVELTAPEGIQVLAGGGGYGISAKEKIKVNCENGAVTFDGSVLGLNSVTVNAKGDITLTEGYFGSTQGDILVTTETGEISAYRESANNLVWGGAAGNRAVFTSPTTIEFNKNNTGTSDVITFRGSVELTAPEGIQVLSGGGYGIQAGEELSLQSGGTIEVTGIVRAGSGITIPATHAITTPAGGRIVQITPEGGDPYYTVTEADGTTEASHVVIGPGYLPGDINGDGAVDNKDVTRLIRYLKYHDVTVVEAALDVNGDGEVNNKDVTRLIRYIKYHDVEIH